jgi:hypothetical protein
MNGTTLARLPLSAKVFCTLFLLGIGLGNVAAFAQAATAVGLSPADVKASLAPEMPMTHLGHGYGAAEKEIALEDVSASAKVWIRTPLLIQTSHTHLFGQTLIAGLLGAIFLFASARETLKTLIVALPFVGTVLDIGGMWLTRFASPHLSVLVIAGGSIFAVGYALIAGIALWQMWIATEVAS